MKKRENPVIQRVSDPFDDLVMDSNKSLKSIYKGSRRNGVRMAKRKKGMTFIPYDYEAAYNKSLEDMHEFFVEQMFKQGKKVVYALKEIRAGDQFEVEIYPQFKKMDEVPPEGRSIKKDNDKAQRNLNDKNARKISRTGICGSRLHTTMSISLRMETSTQQSRMCRNSSDG